MKESPYMSRFGERTTASKPFSDEVGLRKIVDSVTDVRVRFYGQDAAVNTKGADAVVVTVLKGSP